MWRVGHSEGDRAAPSPGEESLQNIGELVNDVGHCIGLSVMKFEPIKMFVFLPETSTSRR